MTDANLGMTFADLAQGAQIRERAAHAIHDARNADETVVEKRSSYALSAEEAVELDAKLDKLKADLFQLEASLRSFLKVPRKADLKSVYLSVRHQG
jgi:ribosomal protein L29